MSHNLFTSWEQTIITSWEQTLYELRSKLFTSWEQTIIYKLKADFVRVENKIIYKLRANSYLQVAEGDLQNVLNFAPPRIYSLSDIMLHIGKLLKWLSRKQI